MRVLSTSSKQKKGRLPFSIFILLGLVLLSVGAFASISFGAAEMDVKTAWGALIQFDTNLTEHHIIRTLRLPRTLADIIVGASLAVCGAIMQGTTRNPLADSGLMGISSGATFAIAICLAFIPQRTYGQTMAFAFAGAAVTTGMTYVVASIGKRGMTPQRLVLAGISISMLFGALTSYLAIRYQIGQSLTYWSAGGTAGAKWDELVLILPFFVGGIVASISLSPAITLLSLGDEVALGLGLNTKFVKGASTIIVLVLTGLSVVVVGPVGFVGLIVPHMIRYFVGVDYRYIIPASALYGAVLTLLADIIGRVINRPFETPMGIIFSVIGVPFFLYLVKTQRREFE